MPDKIQLIKQEIERRIEICEKYSQLNLTESTSIWNHAQLLELREIKDFIDSLPEENHFEDKSEMVSEDLDIAATSIIKRLGGMEKDDCVSEHELKIFKAAIDWQKKKDQETIELAEDHAMLAGMNRMKEEMMKDAVELHIIKSFNPVGMEHEKPHGFTALYDNIEHPYFYPVINQTIKVIPIKE